MTKYIQDLINKLKARKAGMAKYATNWTGQAIQETDIDTILADLQKKDDAINDAEVALQQLRADARDLVHLKEVTLRQIDNLAEGIHALELTKLLDYDIHLPKTKTPKPIPTKGVVVSIKDDTDGEGFILERNTLTDATNYEWQKVAGDDPATTFIDDTKFAYFKTTNKNVFVDDNVKKGVRYFYRFRGINATGQGAWSEPVSRVQ
jgi:hypothetical protein